VVVEAAESSGTLITAEFAQQLGRDVGAVPGQVTARVAVGSNRLLCEGAAVIRSAEDALDELFGVGFGARSAQAREAGPSVPEARPSAPPRPRAVLPRPAPAPEPVLEAGLRKVLDLVEGGETVDAIVREVGLTPGRARAALGRLELLGLVARDGFAGYVRTLTGASPPAPILAEVSPTEPLP
jgi:DNA processing protein